MDTPRFDPNDLARLREIAGRIFPQEEYRPQPAPEPEPDSVNLDAVYRSFSSLQSGIPYSEELQRMYFDDAVTADAFSPERIRRDFPILHQRVNGKPLIWFDNAATTQKPLAVIQEVARFYSEDNSNIHRAAHTLAGRSTDAYETAREKVQRFIHAASPDEIIFVRGTTEGINLVVQTWGRKHIEEGDEIIISTLDHHANIVPWQQLAKEKKARLLAIPVDNRGDIILEDYERLLSPKTKVVSFGHVNNTFGTVTPVKTMIEMARRYNALTLIDGAQSIAHTPVDVQNLDCDFFVFSGHKIYAPNGIGVLYGRRRLLATLPPWQGGGNMIKDVTLEETQFNAPPARFEAGTPNVAGAVGLGLALDYVSRLGLTRIEAYEHELTEYARTTLARIKGLHLIGDPRHRVSVVSFILDSIPTIEAGQLLDKEGIALRAGHHCAQPALRRMGIEASIRPSFAFYNTKEEIDRLAQAILKIQGNYLT
ncbi:MAG: cysteine desulfurase [Tannerellaceae bacterium]|jgi:cysteine desulfurase/selenocysteine lyase|nr:cysteine desulfurase [Tannerellaceae bacterium]